MQQAAPAAENAATEVWQENWESLVLFLDLTTQWRVAVGLGGAAWLGLDYPAAEALIRLRGWKRKKARRVFADLQVMEIAALAAFGETSE